MSASSRPRDNIELLVICEHRRMLEVLSGGFVHLSVLTEKIKLAEEKNDQLTFFAAGRSGRGSVKRAQVRCIPVLSFHTSLYSSRYMSVFLSFEC